MSATQVRVLIAHGEPLLSAGLESALRRSTDIQIVGNVSPAQALSSEAASRSEVDVTLADFDTGVQLAQSCRVVIVTADESEVSVRRALEAGVRGYLPPCATLEAVVQAVHRVMLGGTALDPGATTKMLESLRRCPITKRELEVLSLLTVGLSDKAIANRLGIGVQTSKSHVRKLLAKLDAGSRTHAAAIAQRRGLLPRDIGVQQAAAIRPAY